MLSATFICDINNTSWGEFLLFFYIFWCRDREYHLMFSTYIIRVCVCECKSSSFINIQFVNFIHQTKILMISHSVLGWFSFFSPHLHIREYISFIHSFIQPFIQFIHSFKFKSNAFLLFDYVWIQIQMNVICIIHLNEENK